EVLRGATSLRQGFQWMDGKPLTDEIFTLIMGWETANGPRPGEERQLCFVDLLSHHPHENFDDFLYPTYIMGLAEMGLTEALWHEWTSPDKARLRPDLLDERFRKARVQLFATAFLLAKDSERASSVMNSITWPTDKLH